MKIMFVCRGAEYIGVEYLSACLKAEGHTTGLVFDPGFDDTFFFRVPLLRRLNRWPSFVQRVKEFRPDVLAVSSVSNTYPYIRKLIEEIKKTYQCYTIIGGVHASAIPEYIIQEGLFDAVCIGEGEKAMVELLRYLKEKENPLSLRNFCFLHGQEIVKNPLWPLVEDLDSLPFPDKDLFYKCGAFSTTLAVISGRGCPHSCSYCVNDLWKRKYQKLGRYIRRHSPERIISEIEYFIARYPVKNINFQDDSFTLDKRWLAQFCELYTKSIKLPFQCSTHPLFICDDVARLLKAAGCVSVCMGVQTAVEDKRRKILKRNETNEQIQTAVSLLKKYRLPVYLDYIFGIPGESLEDIVENIKFNRRLRPENTATYILYPFPGTSILHSCRESKVIKDEDFNRVLSGERSFHYESFFQLPNKLISQTAAALFPVLTILPPALSILLVRIFSHKRLQWLVKIMQVLLLPINNIFQFRERVNNYYTMLRHIVTNKK